MPRTLAANCGSLDSLNCRIRCGCRPWRRQIRCTELMLMLLARIAAAVQCVVSARRITQRDGQPGTSQC